MDIFSVTTMLGGLAFFLYGMRLLSDSLEKSYNGDLNKNLKAVTNNKFLTILFGAGLTIAVQSSSAVTVMLVGLVNSGIIEFGDTIGVMMGSNIGTTLTAWILSLAGIDGSAWYINIFKPANFAPILAFIGILITMISKKQKTKNAGYVLLGFAILLFGMTVMSNAMAPLAEIDEFKNILTAFKNPILAVLVGAIFTGVIQSSAASVAILQAFSISGGITYGMAIPLIMGLNIGTCVTALISSIGVSKNAKKVAVTHFTIKIIGTLIFLIPFYVLDAIFNFAFVDTAINPVMIAVIHSVFNIANTVVLLPFTKQLVALTNKLVPGGDKSEGFRIVLDDRLLAMPSVAVERSLETLIDMSDLSMKSFLESVEILFEYNDDKAEEILAMEEQIDKYEDYLGTFMMKLSK
ncbi:MAG: Na/Pi cotransporter family protein, partial [Clostridia bacterium]|nr:Na/Pi cotransporter family protein [Clostridia bacterium]